MFSDAASFAIVAKLQRDIEEAKRKAAMRATFAAAKAIQDIARAKDLAVIEARRKIEQAEKVGSPLVHE